MMTMKSTKREANEPTEGDDGEGGGGRGVRQLWASCGQAPRGRFGRQWKCVCVGSVTPSRRWRGARLSSASVSKAVQSGADRRAVEIELKDGIEEFWRQARQGGMQGPSESTSDPGGPPGAGGGRRAAGHSKLGMHDVKGVCSALLGTALQGWHSYYYPTCAE